MQIIKRFRFVAFTLALLIGAYSASSAQMRIDGIPSVISGTKTFIGHLLFSPDNTYDIGASGATRPRNYFGGGNVTIGGSLIAATGNATLAGSGALAFGSNGGLTGVGDGIFKFANNAGTDFSRLQFGGTTSSFPSLKRSGTELQARLADDSNYAPFIASLYSLPSGGSFNLAVGFAYRTAPTISSGFGTSPSVVASNGTAAFTINVGTGGVATSGVIALPTATTGWRVTCDNTSTNTATVFKTKQTGFTTTTATIGNYDAAGAAAAWVASNVLVCSAMAF